MQRSVFLVIHQYPELMNKVRYLVLLFRRNLEEKELVRLYMKHQPYGFLTKVLREPSLVL
jgi:hypothetical protein